MKTLLLFSFFFLTVLFSNAQTISLAGKWHFEIDRNDIGIKEKWFSKILNDSVYLPGSMLENNKGDEVTLQTKWTGSIYDSSWYFNPRYAKYRQPGNLKFPFWLTPAKYYVGAAWYQKEVVIPASFKNKHINLFLERCHTETMVWVDDHLIGDHFSFVAPHEYDLSKYLTPGKHKITIHVDNRIKEINVGQDSHSLTDHTQGNWNGIVGKIELQATVSAYIDEVQVYPDVDKKAASIQLFCKGDMNTVKQVMVYAKSFNSNKEHVVQPLLINASLLPGKDSFRINYNLGKEVQLWSEFNPALYKLTVALIQKNGERNERQIVFGMRSFKTKGTQFTINDQLTFLRGTVENCVFPLTGYASMKEEDWLRIFKICKSYGLNHMRFHSYCPPEAAFAAADKVGFYLQPEGPSWANHGSSLGDGKPIDKFIYDETKRIEKYYGNHPSYCMLAYGNEPRGSKQVVYLTNFIHYWQQKDNRRLYTGASVAMSWPLVPANEYMIKSGARNLAWNKMPESKSDYTVAIEKFTMPYVAHEMGQWCVFPYFKEISKYTGVYKAKNFELFQDDLKDAGMLDEADRFVQASGKLQVLCYKNEIEKSLRTPGNGGFQLLSLTDYPGQGTALVGPLDAFWDEKGYVDAKAFSRFCNTTVPLTRFEKFQFTNEEVLKAGVEIYHYGKENLQHAKVFWRIKDVNGKVITKKVFPAKDIETGKNTVIGDINFSLTSFQKATQLIVEVGVENTSFVNDWNVWVFPAKLPTLNNESIYYTTSLDEKAEDILNKGGKVFLNVAGKVVKGKEVSQTFLPVFWNTSWFKMRPPHTLGILLNDHHPAFADFPTSFHSDMQWWELLNKTQVMHLEDFSKNFRPLVQPIDTWFMNRRLALIFEAKVGHGKIIVSSADMSDSLQDKPASKQLFYSLEKYMLSDRFNPSFNIDIQLIRNLVSKPSRFVFDAYTKDSPDELKPKSVIIHP
ncbi:MAG: beta-glucuronidase [Bacteroidota bacterium]|nr:beta-glucuronidase [Bacteroidota bacterium]